MERLERGGRLRPEGPAHLRIPPRPRLRSREAGPSAALGCEGQVLQAAQTACGDNMRTKSINASPTQLAHVAPGLARGGEEAAGSAAGGALRGAH
mmetsp:Transcript_81481/g.144177  ORF Transcript_81481/g.144177 Transcript_81481/m.144177 type:complete len:95 (+) Transcript_81481:93-377(+)